jgi:hypothetical protein
LAAPEVPVDAPVEGELEGPPVEASAASSVPARSRRYGGVGGGVGVQDVDFGAHGGEGPSGRAVWEGKVVVRGRNAALSSRMCLARQLEVAGLALLPCDGARFPVGGTSEADNSLRDSFIE